MRNEERTLFTRLVGLALDEKIRHQDAKVLARARALLPYLTAEDVKNPDDYPVVRDDPLFNYELGTLEGYSGARLSLLALVRQDAQSDDCAE